MTKRMSLRGRKPVAISTRGVLAKPERRLEFPILPSFVFS